MEVLEEKIGLESLTEGIAAMLKVCFTADVRREGGAVLLTFQNGEVFRVEAEKVR